MPMAPFYTRFPDLAFEEMRTVYVQGHPRLPDGHYGFLELYCNEKGCDCRRAILQVVSPLTKDKVWATINYGWENVEYYESWMPGDRETAREMAGATLDTLNVQTRYANALLELFESLLLTDQAYVDRLKRHYRQFKEAIRNEDLGNRSRRKKRRSGT
jgi:hypothetical protein